MTGLILWGISTLYAMLVSYPLPTRHVPADTKPADTKPDVFAEIREGIKRDPRLLQAMFDVAPLPDIRPGRKGFTRRG